MKKIPTVYLRDWENDPHYVTREVNPLCAWVFTDSGVVASRKYDGTCVRFDGGQWWARREVKKGKQPPPDFVEVEHDPETGKRVGWEPAERSGFAKWLRAVLRSEPPGSWPVGTYELCGPRVNGNPEGFDDHLLIPHDMADVLVDVPRDFDGLAVWLHSHSYEGIVWCHEDGRMAKLKRRDVRKGA